MNIKKAHEIKKNMFIIK